MKRFKFQLVALLFGLNFFISCKKENGDIIVTNTVDFENLTIENTGYWNGSDGSGSFALSGMTFINEYSAQYASWQGFSYSQMADAITAGFGNLYSVFDAGNGGNKFALYYQPYFGDDFAHFSAGMEYRLQSLKVCNSTYAALSMKNGDSFAKKFGGDSGNDKDWFKMTVIGYDAAGDSVHSVDYYLADYRFDDNSKDYIINEWTNVDLTPLGKVNKITFRFSSSDTGAYGMNNPAIACIDDLKYETIITGHQ